MNDRCHVINVIEWTDRQQTHLALFRAGIEERMQLSGQCRVMTSAADCKVSEQQLGQIGGAWLRGYKAMSRLRVVIAWGSSVSTRPL